MHRPPEVQVAIQSYNSNSVFKVPTPSNECTRSSTGIMTPSISYSSLETSIVILFPHRSFQGADLTQQHEQVNSTVLPNVDLTQPWKSMSSLLATGVQVNA